MKKNIRKTIMIYTLAACTTACEGEAAYRSPDYQRASELLPPKEEYTQADMGTRHMAEEIKGTFNTWISMIYFDKDRTTPALYFTGGRKEVNLSVNPNGTLHLSLQRFNTNFMPLHLSVEIDIIPSQAADTIHLRGEDGQVRTTDDGKTIGLPLPESDDARLTGYYLRSTRKLNALIDLMLPIPMKSTVEGNK